MEITVLKCENCGKPSIKPKYTCPSCLSDQLLEEQLSGKGTIYSFTTVRITSEKFSDQAPYEVILVELDDGLKVTARLTEGKAEIGKQVELSHFEDEIYWFKTE